MFHESGALLPLNPDFPIPDCACRGVLEHVTSRWGTVVLCALLNGTHRFGELRRRLGGISVKMLVQTLQILERDGFVHREARPVIPQHVDYSLTALGVEVAEQLGRLAYWIEGSMERVEQSRERYDQARAARVGAENDREQRQGR